MADEDSDELAPGSDEALDRRRIGGSACLPSSSVLSGTRETNGSRKIDWPS
jgi:hypothetical protein